VWKGKQKKNKKTKKRRQKDKNESSLRILDTLLTLARDNNEEKRIILIAPVIECKKNGNSVKFGLPRKAH
jgi:hypothetical protein